MAESRHPGGLRLTARAARLAGLVPGARAIDIGCGDGASVELLRGQGIDAVGIDRDAAALPFPDAAFDAALFECVLSVLGDEARRQALREALRVLRPGGRLIVSDVYRHSAADLRALLEDAGFSVLCEEDHTPALVTYLAERGRGAGGGFGYVLFICVGRA